jgi:hypothetical protein
VNHPKPRPKTEPSTADVAGRGTGVASIGVRKSGNRCRPPSHSPGGRCRLSCTSCGGYTSHLSLAGANSSRRPLFLTPRLCICLPTTTIPSPTPLSRRPLLHLRTVCTWAIYRSDQRSIPILASTNAHSFKHAMLAMFVQHAMLVQSPHPATTTCPDATTPRADARKRLPIQNATQYARILYLS